MRYRAELLARLRTQSFDLLIIGGGIMGAGIARDAVLRGLRVAAIEQGDFAGGTSSNTSKLIHGGLRYLEQGRLRLVRQSVRERHTLWTIAPNLVQPQSFLLPCYRGDARSPWMLAAGLYGYEALALGRSLGMPRMLSASEAVRREPRLGHEHLRAAASYRDCQMDDARLCLATMLQAVGFGAICCNYVRLVAFERAGAALSGAVVEDVVSGESWSIKARVFVNATGPWSDAVRRLSDPRAGRAVAPTKGIHLIVPRLTEQAVTVPVRADRRVLFLLPWGDYSIIGTTESPDADQLEALQATREEVDYLLAEINRVLPTAHLGAGDVLATYAGARPLLAFTGSATRASREHRLEVDRHGLVSVLGGKYTTFRAIAQQAVDAIVHRQRWRAERCLTDQISVVEATHPMVLDRWRQVTRRLAPELLARLLAVYGVGTFRILALVEFEPGLSQPVCPHHAHIQAELVYAVQEELACTVSDVLIRRTRIAYSRCQGLDFLSTLRDVLARYGRCSAESFEEQVAVYRSWLARSVAFRANSNSGTQLLAPA